MTYKNGNNASRSHLEKTAACFTASSSAVSHWGSSMPNCPAVLLLPALPELLPCRNLRTVAGSLVPCGLPLDSAALAPLLA